LNRTFDRYFSLVLIGICAVLIYESSKILGGSFGSTIGPGMLPMVLAGVLALLSLLNIYQTFRVKYPNEKKPKLQYKRFLIILVSSTLYCLLLEPLGYVISTFIFLMVGFQVMQKGKIWYSLIFAAAISYFVYFLYVDIMKGSLPGFPVWLGM
jgi:putative tricarboxylic transport membrane protein